MPWVDAKAFCEAKEPAGTWSLVTFQGGKPFLDAVTGALSHAESYTGMYVHMMYCY